MFGIKFPYFENNKYYITQMKKQKTKNNFCL